MTIAQANATLTLVEGGHEVDAFNDEASAAAKWAGSERVYLRVRRREQQTPDGLDVAVSRVLLVPQALGVDWQDEDRVTIVADSAAAPAVFTVAAVDRSDAPAGIPAHVATFGLTLDG